SVTQRAVFVRTVSVFFAVTAAVPVVTQFGEGLQGAEFGFRSGREAKRCTGVLAPGVALDVAQRTSVNAIAARSVVTNIAMNTQAGFGAWDVEVAGAVSIADADIFNGFWLWRDDCVGSLSAGSCNQSCSGAKEKALDVHF